MAEETKAPLQTYRGNCHCGAHIFEAKMPEITKLNSCNCSICYKKATAWAMPIFANVRWVKGGLETMTGYNFGTKKVEHKFCETCGTTIAFVGYFVPLKEGEKRDPNIGLNLRCLQYGEIGNIWDMETDVFDGASLGSPYEPPAYTGAEPGIAIEGGKLYTGSCHCGAVKVALKSKPLDKTFKEDIYECNCSGCVRAGGTVIYPHKDALVIDGEENTAGYSYGWLRAWDKYWCKTCGVFVGRRPLPLSEDVVAKLPQEVRKWTVDMVDMRPINLRIMNGVDLKELNITHIDGYTNIPPMYKNP